MRQMESRKSYLYNQQWQKELECCSYVTGKEREMVAEFLWEIGVDSLGEVTLETEEEFRDFVAQKEFLSPNQKKYYAAAFESVLFCYWRPFFPDLVEEVKAYGELSRVEANKILHYLMMQGIHRLEEIDYQVREAYESYVAKAALSRMETHLKVLDRLKLFAIKKKQERQPFRPCKLLFQEAPIYLGYHPDYAIARSFYYLRNKQELLFDFSLQADVRLKKQIFAMLNHVLETEYNWKNRRERFLLPLQKLYLFCVQHGISDLEKLEKTEIEAFRGSMEGKVGTKTNLYMQIVGNVRKYLFLHAEKTNWDANVWYLARFSFKNGRINPANSPESFHFYDILQVDNRKLFQAYMRYCIGVSNKAIHSIQGEYYHIKDFLLYCDRMGYSLTEVSVNEVDRYIKEEEEKELLADTFNKILADIHGFFCFLLIKGYIKKNPLCLEYYLKKVLPTHRDRCVSEESQGKLLAHLKYFPEHLRLMFLHLWSVGLRINEVCCIKGDAYFWRGQDAWIRIYQHKMKTEKMIPIPTVLYQLMTEYIKKKQIGPEEYVFQNRKGGAYKSQTFCTQMQRLCKVYGLECEDFVFRSHDYRHGVATKMYQQGVSIQAVRDYLGHKEEDMTKQYLDYIPDQIDERSDLYYQSARSLGKKTRRKKEQDGSKN